MDLQTLLKNPNQIYDMKEDTIVKILEEASDAYHNTGVPIITDDMYDALKQRLQKLKPNHPFLKQVGAPVRGEKVKLPYFMGSLDKIRDDPKHLANFKKKYPGRYVVSDKLDGISALAVYSTPPKLYTRGDGVNGQDISHLLTLMPSFPKASSVPKNMVVRGEIILSRSSWDKLKHKGSNARNVVAGTVNAKNPDREILQEVQFVAYEVLSPKELPSIAFDHMKTIGFKIPHNIILTEDELVNEELSKILIQRREKSEFECDGIVVRHDAEHKYISGKNPAYAFAYKSILTHEEAEVIVQKVEWNFSKDGFIKPTIIFDTVVLAGVKIQRASGFNGQFIEKNKIGPGSRIVIIRSGDVIPHVVRVLSPAMNNEPSMPTIPYVWTDTHVDIMVAEGEANEEVQLKQIEYFVNQMDIKYLAKGTITKLYGSGIKTIPELMNITESQLLKIDGIQKSGASRIIKSIEKTREKATVIDYMVASNMFSRGVARKKLELLTQKYPGILKGEVPTYSSNDTIEGLSGKTIKDMLSALPSVKEFIKDIDPNIFTKVKTVKSSDKVETSSVKKSVSKYKELENKTIIFTGFRNKVWEELLLTVNCKISGNISKSLDLVVALDTNEESSKLVKARGYGLKIISKKDFQDKYGLP